MDHLETELKRLAKRFGLSSYELKAYLYLIKVGGGNAREINENANIPLTRVYSVMKALEKRVLISTNRLSTPIHYSVKDPESSLRFMLKKYQSELNDDVEKLERRLENVLGDLKFDYELPPEWSVYHGDDVVYRSLIPSLVAGSNREVLIVGSNITQTMTKEYLEEFRKALDRGVVFKAIGPMDVVSTFTSFFHSFDNVFGLAKLAKIAVEHWGKRFFMRRNSLLEGVTAFGVFDNSKVGFSIVSPLDGRYLVTLVTDAKDIVEDFHGHFHDIWQDSTELNMHLLAKKLRIR